MKSKGQNYKISEVISLSNQYKMHRNQLQTIKPVIHTKNPNRQKSIHKLAQEKLRYRQAIRDYNDQALQVQNDRLTSRIFRVSQQRSKQSKKLFNSSRQHSKTRFSPYGHNCEHQSSRSLQKSPQNSNSKANIMENKDLNKSKSNRKLLKSTSSRSLSSISSNYRQRSIKQKQIDRQNLKIAARITNPKSIRALARTQLNKSYQKQQQYVRIRSRFSQRNQEIVRSLAMQGLKLERRDVQYLPQLTNKKIVPIKTRKNINKIQSSTLQN